MPLESATDTIDRRRAVGLLLGSVATASLPRRVLAVEESPPGRTGLGLVTYCRRFRRRQLMESNVADDLFEPLRFLEHCRELGAGGMQVAIGVRDAAFTRRLRDECERWGMFVEAIVEPPVDAADVQRFDAEMRTAKEAGALAARTVVMPGRRYERFESLEEFRRFEALGRRLLERAAPIAERHRLPLAVENHKDQRIDERLALFEHVGSEYVGACVDTGNSVALLEDAHETVAALAPWAFSVHLKDQAVREYPDGFLLADVPLGEGMFDLRQMVGALRRAKPKVRFSLELITRDPLKVPCLTEAFWATLPNVPGTDLARTLRTVRANAAETLDQVESLPLKEQVDRETANVLASLEYAVTTLRI